MEVIDIPMDMTEGANVSRNSSLENIIMDNLEHDLGEAKSFPDLDNVTNDTQGRHGLGQLGANLEFMPGSQLFRHRVVSVNLLPMLLPKP